jgi:hypothetical protein
VVASGETLAGASRCFPWATVGICVIPPRLQGTRSITLRIKDDPTFTNSGASVAIESGAMLEARRMPTRIAEVSTNLTMIPPYVCDDLQVIQA